ncbi:glycosyltransferase family 4 protein [Enterobacter cancerogenus]|uniref:Glycosyltransferase family 4 protein n=1 Tax=Enterobacter cancerogenus TaxID=69218 RepID=A0AB38P715_9ENTR|nr:glycosyltransferase family 4 protein [Enterobacter cancerogenus]TKK20648.1 glycosyltransferase family 4 protein [Enterobacter cancerogenus]
MKLYVFLGDLSSKGGIERVSVALANGLAKCYDVTIISLYRSTKYLTFIPSDKVNVIYLHDDFEKSMYNRNLKGISGLKFDFMYMMRKLKQLKKINLNLSKNDVLLSCDIKMSLLLALFARKSKIIAIEHFEHDIGNAVLRKIRGKLYPKFSAVVSQTLEDQSKYLKWLPQNKHKIIPNIVSFEAIESSGNEIKQKIVLAVGRLTYQKGFDLLLQAWAEADTNDWSLKIVGDGEEYDNLNSLITKLKISNAEIVPFQTNIQYLYCSSEIFVLSSRFEGLGMVLIEALTCGLACISFDCPAGPKTIITSDNGVLVPTGDIKKLSQSISFLINNEDERKRLQKKSAASVDRFKETNVIAKWRELLNEIQ